MELDRSSKPTHQDTAEDGSTISSVLERTAEGRHPALESASSRQDGNVETTDSSAKMDSHALLLQPSKWDQGFQSSNETLRLARFPPSTDADKVSVSTSTRVAGPASESASSPMGSIALNTSKEKAVPLVFIKQGSPSEKLLVYAHAATGSNYQGGVPFQKTSVSQNEAAKCAEKITSVTVFCNKETVDLGGNSKDFSSPSPQDLNPEDVELATPADPIISLQSAKSTDVCFLGQLGLKKVGESLQASSKTKDAVKKEDAGSYCSERGVDQQTVADKDVSGDSISKEVSLKKNDAPMTGSAGQVSQSTPLQANQPPNVVPIAAPRVPIIKVISSVGDNNTLAEVDISGMNSILIKDGQASSVPTSNAATVSGKNTPIYIKVKLEEKDITIICCPVALLLQHEKNLDVTLQANNPNAYSIKCRKCSHEVSEPYAMLQHLKVQHQIQGCLQKLLNLNSQHLGCMSKPVCVNIPGVLTLPNGLADMEQGVIRFNSLGIPRLSFVCRLCPLNFHTARGLSSHHQYFMRSMYNKSQHSVNNSMWFCRLCPRQFRNFLDYYAHHKWMRVSKDLFLNTDQVSKKKRFQVMDESGKVVASMEVPKSHSLSIKTWPAANSDSIENIGWGRKPSLLDDGSPLGRLDQLIPELNEHDIDGQVPVFSTAIPLSTPEGMRYKQQTEGDKERKTAPPLFQTLDSLCRRLAQRVDSSSTGLDRLISVGDKQVDDDYEYMCGICHKTFPRLPQMQGHMGSHVRRHRSNKSAPPAPATIATPPADPPCVERPPVVEPADVEYKCGVCHKIFPKLDQMQLHSECHNNRLHPATKKPMKSLDTPFLETVKLMSFTCDICQWSFPTEHKLWDHRMTHGQKRNADTGTKLSSEASWGIQKKTLFVCVYCKKSFARQVNLKFHLKKHGLEKPLQGSNRISTCIKVVATDNPDLELQHVCSQCGKAFRSQRQLKSHKAWHARVKRGSDEPQISSIENSTVSKIPYTCNTCNKICSSSRELHDHKKQHATPWRLLVRPTLDDEESGVVKKRTIAQRSCNKKKNKEASEADASRNNMKRRSTRHKKEGLFKYFCRNCRSYFKSSQHFARHMAVHSNLVGFNSRLSPGSPSSRARSSKFRKEPMQKWKETEVSGDNSSDGIDMSRPMPPSATDDQTQAINCTSSKDREEKVGETNMNSAVHEDSSCNLKKSVTDADELSPQASNKSTEQKYTDPVISSTVSRDASAEMENARKQKSSDESACPNVGKMTSPMLVDTKDASLNETMASTGKSKLAKYSSDHQDILSTVENLGCSAKLNSPANVLKDESKIAQTRNLTTQAMVCDGTNAVMQDANPHIPNIQLLENCEGHSPVVNQFLQEHMADTPTQPTVVTENKDKNSTPISIKESEANPVVNGEHVQYTDKPVQKENTTIADDFSTEVEETKPEVESSLIDAYSCKSLSSDIKNLQGNQGLTKKQEDDQLSDDLKHVQESCSKMATSSRETKPSVADEPVSLMVIDAQKTTPLASALVSFDGQLSEKSSIVMNTGSLEARPSVHGPPSLLSWVKLPKEDSCPMVVAESQEAPMSLNGDVLAVEDSVTGMVSESWEPRAGIPDGPPVLRNEVHPQNSIDFTLKESNKPSAITTHVSSFNPVLEDRRIPKTLDTLELQYSEVETNHLETSSGHSQKQDGELLMASTNSDSVQNFKVPDGDFSEPHSSVIDGLHAVQENSIQGTKACVFETQRQDDEVQVKLQVASEDDGPTNQAPALNPVAELVVFNDSNAVARSHETKLLERSEAPLAKEDNSTDHSTAFDASVGVEMNVCPEAKSSSSDALFAEKSGQSHTSEPPAQESDKLTRDIAGTINSDADLQVDQEKVSPQKTLETFTQPSSASADKQQDSELTEATANCDDSVVVSRAGRATRPSIYEAWNQNITKPSKVTRQRSDGGISTPPQVGSRLKGPGTRPTNLHRYICDICNKSFSKKAQLRGHKVNHTRCRVGPYSSRENSGNTAEACEDESLEFTIMKDCNTDKGNSSNSLLMEEDGVQVKSANDLPANSTDSVGPVAEVISVNQQMGQSICIAQKAPNLLSGACLSQVGVKPLQQLYPDPEASDHLKALSGSVCEKVRKAASNADIERKSPNKAFTLRSTNRNSEVDASSKARPTDKSKIHQTISNSEKKIGEKEPFSCPHCEKSYTHINQLNAHKRVHMKTSKLCQYNKGSTDGPKGKGRKIHKCPICHASFYNYKKFCGHRGAHISHKLTKFRKYNSGSPERSCKDTSESKPRGIKPKGKDTTSAEDSKKHAGKFTCKFCPETLQNVAQFRNHILVTHPMTQGKPFLLKPFTCELCGKSFTKSKQRQLHMRLHGKKRRRRRFKRTMSLQDTDHSYYKKLPAQNGGTPAESIETQKHKLDRKEEKISREEGKISKEEIEIPNVEAPKKKTFKCRVCDKPFKNQYQVAGHMSVHKRFPCQLCPASFTLARQLCGHLKVHGGLQKKVVEESPSLDSGNQSSVSQSSPAYIESQRVPRFTAGSQNNALLKRVIKVFLSGPKLKKRHKKRIAGKWLQPKGSLKRALMKNQQVQMQNIIGILRKSIILEIDADSHRLVYECKGCQKIAYCHKNILRHYLEKHLQSTEGTEDVLQAASTRRADTMPAPNPRFRNKSKIGCPICKGSSGFQCHLHNEDEQIAIDTLLRHDDYQEVFECDSCDGSFSSYSKLVQHRKGHAKKQPGERFCCSQCPFQAKCIQSLRAHQQFHSEKREAEPPKGAADGEKLMSCPLCSFKTKNVYGLAAHSRVHKGKGKKRPLEGIRQSPEPSSSTCPSLSLDGSPESTQTSSDGTKHRKNAYNCFVCSRYFYTVKTYQKHMKTHEQLFQFKCSVCSFSFLSATMLDDHIKSSHSLMLPYTCNECMFSSHSFESVKSHIQAHSEAKEKKERQAYWSAYLKAVLQRKGPEAEATSVSSNERVAIPESRPSSVFNYESQAQALDQSERSCIVSNLHLEQVRNQSTTNSGHEDPTLKEVASKSVMDIETRSVDKQTEDNPHQLSDSPDEYFACSHCKDFRASSKEEWDRHIDIVHKGSLGPKKLKCSMCQYTTISQERLEQHMKLHRHQTLQCNTCMYRTPMRHLMIRHVQTVHRQHKPFQCKLCTYATAYRHHLRRHAEKHKNPNFRCRYRKLMKKGDWQTAESSNRVICKDCGRELQNKKTLRNHYIKVHGRIPSGKNLNRVQDSSSGEINPEMKNLPSYSVIIENVTPAQIEKTYECSVCSFIFKRRSDLNQHKARGHVEAQASLPCQCPQCGLVTGSGQLQHHMQIHQEENLLQCQEEGCNFSTAQAVHLQRHQNKHPAPAERDVPVTCLYCQVNFPNASSLQIHNTQVHSEQTNTISTRTPFLCSLCPFTSTNEKDANRHFKLHNYNLAFKCEYCVFSSSTASAIATHQKIHRFPRRNLSTTLVSKKASTQQRQTITSSTLVKSADNQNVQVGSTTPERPRPKHVFISNKGKKLYECRYCQRFFDVAEAWQRHELRHMTEWPQY